MQSMNNTDTFLFGMQNKKTENEVEDGSVEIKATKNSLENMDILIWMTWMTWTFVAEPGSHLSPNQSNDSQEDAPKEWWMWNPVTTCILQPRAAVTE